MTNIVDQYLDTRYADLKDLADKIWQNPELAFREFKSSKLIVDFLKEEGFTVEYPYVGMQTAIRAEWGEGKPVIGFLGEYDALAGLSQKSTTKKEPISPDGPGHGCGHNLIAMSAVGAAIGLKHLLEETHTEGTVVFYGCPGEETLTGKGFMARGGAFKELDAALSFHSSNTNFVNVNRMTATRNVEFHFEGNASHAALSPEKGRSALKAVELTNIAANYMREHLPSEVRMHYSITDGGPAPNIVAPKASVWYYVRAFDTQILNDTYDWLVQCAKAAAMATQTKLEIQYNGGCNPCMPNHVLAEVILENMDKFPAPNFTDDEKKFAYGINLNSPLYQGTVGTDHEVTLENSLATKTEQKPPHDMYASNDTGDVQHIVPGVALNLAGYNSLGTAHSWMITACVGTEIGTKVGLRAAKILAQSAYDMVKSPSILKAAKEEFDKKMNGRGYESFVADIPLPHFTEPVED